MTSEHRSCGIGSFLPMSCRGRAEAFARRLQTRLHHLGGTSESDTGDSEESWLTSQSHFPTLHQPRHSTSSESDIYYDFDLDSPGSPQEEATESILLNGDKDVESGCVSAMTATSPGSDSSDGNYYDPDGFDFHLTNGESQQPTTTSEYGAKRINIDGKVTKLARISVTEEEEDEKEEEKHENSESESLDPSTEEVDEDESDNERINRERQMNKYACKSESIDTIVDDEITDATVGDETLEVDSSRVDVREAQESTDSYNEFEGSMNDVIDTMKEVVECMKGVEMSIASLKADEKEIESIATRKDDQETFCSTLFLVNERVIECETGNKECHVTLSEAGNDGCHAIESECHLTLSEAGHKECHTIESEAGNECHVTLSKAVDKECHTIESEVGNKDVTQNERLITCQADIKESLMILKEAGNKVCHVTVNTCDDDDDEEEERPQRVQRCSSLKTGKTPPGTPGRKKIVRFADVLGLDLADVRTFLDEIPKVPTSAYEDLHNADLSLGNTLSASLPRPERALVPLFQQPGGAPDFLDKVRRQHVCLENAMVKDMTTCAITGTVRVLNLDFNKSVHVRYSLDNWRSFSDLQATYVANSCDGFSDKFSFVLYAHTLVVGQRIEFAVRFQCHGVQYWDSNAGINYIFQCLPPANPPPFLSLATPDGDRWASFY